MGHMNVIAVPRPALGTTEELMCALHAARVEVDELKRALETSRRIGMAMGILMGIHKLGPDEAFDLLRQASQNHNRKLRDVASDVVEQGCLPEYPRRGPELAPGIPVSGS